MPELYAAMAVPSAESSPMRQPSRPPSRLPSLAQSASAPTLCRPNTAAACPAGVAGGGCHSQWQMTATGHIPWKRLQVTVRAGPRTLTERLVDRDRDCDRERSDEDCPGGLNLTCPAGGLGGQLQRAWASQSKRLGKFGTISPRVANMLRQTEQIQRMFTPAPLEDARWQMTAPVAGKILGIQPLSCAGKGEKGKVYKPTARSSLTVTKGCRLAQLIESGCIGLVRSAYFEDCMLHNRPFSMRQLIPNSFVWRGDEAVDLWWKHGKCFLLVVSYPWLSRDHPDPDQVHLRKLVRILEEYKKIWGIHEVAVILDYCSLWQRGARVDTRTAEQRDQFGFGVREMSVAYAHKAITAVRLTGVPGSELRKYEDRGWTLMESVLIDSKGGDWNRWTFGEFDPDSTQWGDSVVFFMQAKPPKLRPPLTPKGFAEELDIRRQRCRRNDVPLFASERDNEEVPKRYEEVYLQFIHSTKLSYEGADWSDEEVMRLLEVVANCDKLESLQLGSNRITQQGASEVAKLIPQLPALKFLGLRGNPLCKESQATELLRLVWGREKKPQRNLLM